MVVEADDAVAARESVVAAFESALAAHDAAVAARGLEIWVGGEPTFTDRHAVADEWLGGALGGDKQARAEAMARRLAAARPGAFVLRTVGRQYPQEERPRWSIGLYAARDGRVLYRGPADRLLGGGPSLAGAALRLRDALAAELARRQETVHTFDVAFDVARAPGDASPCSHPCSHRLVYAAAHEARALRELVAGHAALAEAARVELERSPLAESELPSGGPIDALAAGRIFLVTVVGLTAAEEGRQWVQLELPAFARRADFETLLELLAPSCERAGVRGLAFTGYGPPVDGEVHWETLTPDPGVVEVNMAPAPDARAFYGAQRRVYRAACDEGLAPERLYFNGEVADSGGGGHITLGGPAPLSSPFLQQQALLPRLIAYLLRHPALSYLFSDRVGSSSQAPRVDEGSREGLAELELALGLLARAAVVTPETLWRQLAPFLVDRFGNTHRAEINVEKLWNPLLGARGQQGLVELRAFRMPPTPEHWAALAALWRALLAHLAVGEAPTTLQRWGDTLHERFTLPFYLEQDLAAVLVELSDAGLGLAEVLVERLYDDAHRRLGVLRLGGVELTLRRAVEPWPLVGDLSAQDGTSRIVDPSCQRVELLLRVASPAGSASEALLDDWIVAALGHAAPLVDERDARSGARVRVTAIRYRACVPPIALHPLLPAQSPLGLLVASPGASLAYRVTLHDWKPDGGVYEGLPGDAAEAAARRRARITVERVAWAETLAIRPAPPAACSAHGLDARWL